MISTGSQVQPRQQPPLAPSPNHVHRCATRAVQRTALRPFTRGRLRPHPRTTGSPVGS
jgi:hypothetical protein